MKWKKKMEIDCIINIYELYNSTNSRNQAYLLLDTLLLIQIYKKKNNFTQNSLSVSSSPRLVVP